MSTPGELYHPFGNNAWDGNLPPKPENMTEEDCLDAVKSNWKNYQWIPWKFYAKPSFQRRLLDAFLDNAEIHGNLFFRDCLIETYQLIKNIRDPQVVFLYYKRACIRVVGKESHYA